MLESLFDLDDNRQYRRTGAMEIRQNRPIYLFDFDGGTDVNRTSGMQKCLLKIAEASLLGDRSKLELVLIQAIRSLKQVSPETSKELSALLSQHTVNANGLRWKESGPPPMDSEEGMALVRSENVEEADPPVFSQALSNRIDQFLCERRDCGRLIEEGFRPPGSLLLTGAPGTGKTMLARWLAQQLETPFITLDLATSISSYLGKTGFNLRRTLDFARSKPCLLLLDEFDALAKRRDDTSDVGELKRIVNVLLKELEDWPFQSVLVAATNHPELLDRAIRRRFDIVLELPLPAEAERLAILERAGGRFSSELPSQLLEMCAQSLDGASGSELQSLMVATVRQHLAAGVPLVRSLVSTLQERLGERLESPSIGNFLRTIQKSSGGTFKVRELAELVGRSVSTVQHHLKRGTIDG